MRIMTEKIKKAAIATKQEVADRLSFKTVSSKWKKIRNISGTISIAGGLIMAAPVSIPATVLSWISYITLASGVIAGRAHLDKSAKSN